MRELNKRMFLSISYMEKKYKIKELIIQKKNVYAMSLENMLVRKKIGFFLKNKVIH